MFCKYSIEDIKLDNLGWNKRICTILNEICPFQYKCNQINNWRNYDNLEKKCTIYNKEREKEYMKQGKYKVLYENRGKLYIELDSETSIVVPNPFDKEDIPKGVDLVKVDNEYFVDGFEPKKKEMFSDVVELNVEPKKNYNKKETQK